MPKARSFAAGAIPKLAPLDTGRKLVKDLVSEGTKGRQLTEFQLAVLAACSCVPSGYVATYGKIAQYCGYPGSARAVGQALAGNPHAPTVPCHPAVGTH